MGPTRAALSVGSSCSFGIEEGAGARGVGFLHRLTRILRVCRGTSKTSEERHGSRQSLPRVKCCDPATPLRGSARGERPAVRCGHAARLGGGTTDSAYWPERRRARREKQSSRTRRLPCRSGSERAALHGHRSALAGPRSPGLVCVEDEGVHGGKRDRRQSVGRAGTQR